MREAQRKQRAKRLVDTDAIGSVEREPQLDFILDKIAIELRHRAQRSARGMIANHAERVPDKSLLDFRFRARHCAFDVRSQRGDVSIKCLSFERLHRFANQINLVVLHGAFLRKIVGAQEVQLGRSHRCTEPTAINAWVIACFACVERGNVPRGRAMKCLKRSLAILVLLHRILRSLL